MLPVLIAGGGIGGLTLAIALARRGIRSQLFEARHEPPGEGAGIQLGPNATRLLQGLGLTDALDTHAVSPDCINVNCGISGAELTRLPLGEWIAGRHGSPYWVIHRGHLHETLWSAASLDPLIEIETGRAVSHIDDDTDAASVKVHFDTGGHAIGAMLIGADGLWSKIRDHVTPGSVLSYAGVTAARALVIRDQLNQRFQESATGVWLAPNAHVVHYPVDGGRSVAVVAIGACDEPPNGWSSAISRETIASRFAQMPDPVRDLLAAADEWRQWALFDLDGATQWSKGRTVLIGDAAHPIRPYLAQGGAMAIEDACELAATIDGMQNVPQAFADFSQSRRDRVTKVQAASLANGRAYHLDGLTAKARNAALRTMPGSVFMRRYDWIYGYRAGSGA